MSLFALMVCPSVWLLSGPRCCEVRLRMILMTALLSAFVAIPLLAPLSSAQAGKYNQVLDIGSIAPQWEALPAIDGNSYSSEDFAEVAVTVVVFTCNDCPYAIDYEERLQALQTKYADDDRVRIVAINSNAIAADSLEAMRERSTERGFTFLYLKDQQSAVAEAFGAVRTPEWFVLDADRRVVYMGAFDDSADADMVMANYVETAVECVLEKRAIETTETAPVGCLIRRPRRR